jgi:membrane fusion protein, multidrug efflux system
MIRLLLASLVLLLTASACKRAEPAARTRPPVPVQVASAVRESVPVTVTAIGTVQPLRTVAIKPRVDGLITTIHFREGDEVKAGDLLVTLDRLPFENELASARAEHAEALADYERYQRLDEQKAVSKQQLVQLATKAETTRAAAAAAALRLGYTEIRAPIDGRTGQRLVHEGALVRAADAQPLVVINQLAPAAVTFSVAENVLADVRSALAAGPVKVTTQNAAGKPLVGTLDFIDNTVDPTTGTIVLKAIFPNTDRALWPGQFVTTVTQVGTDKDVVLVPAPAVQTGQRGPQVFVVTAENTVDLRPVKTGRTSNDRTVLLSGVEAGETVVTDGQLRLVPNAPVVVRTLEEAAAPREGGKKRENKS